MKRYLLGIFALVLAVGFSAFTDSKKATQAPTTAYNYWYNVVDDEIVSEFTAGQGLSKDQIESISPCEDDGNVLCLVGSNTPLSGAVSPASFDEDAKFEYQP